MYPSHKWYLSSLEVLNSRFPDRKWEPHVLFESNLRALKKYPVGSNHLTSQHPSRPTCQLLPSLKVHRCAKREVDWKPHDPTAACPVSVSVFMAKFPPGFIRPSFKWNGMEEFQKSKEILLAFMNTQIFHSPKWSNFGHVSFSSVFNLSPCHTLLLFGGEFRSLKNMTATPQDSQQRFKKIHYSKEESKQNPCSCCIL